jgi:hypothetical protein
MPISKAVFDQNDPNPAPNPSGRRKATGHEKLGAALGLATVAEAHAAHHAVKNAAEKWGAAGSKKLLESGGRGRLVGGAGLQVANLGVGALAAGALLKKPKGKGVSNMSTDQSMISKSVGAVSGNGHGKNLVEKGIPSVAKPLLDSAGKYTEKVAQANSDLLRVPKKPYGGKMGFFRAATSANGKQAARVSGAERSRLIQTGRDDKADLNRMLSSYRPTGSLAAVGKAYRRFDPEADRQRRMGQAQGLSLATGILAGAGAKKHFTTDIKSGAKKVRGIAAKPGQGKKGLALAGLSAVATLGGLGSYKHSLSARNQPWT